jgi:hypothetical protein
MPRHRTCQNFFLWRKTSHFKAALTTPSQPLTPNLMVGTTHLRTCHCPLSSLYKLHSPTAIFLFGFLNWRCDRYAVWNIGKILPWYSAQQQGECGSHLLHGGRPTSHPDLVAITQILPQCCFGWTLIVVPMNFLSVSLFFLVLATFLHNHQSVFQPTC